MPQRRRKADAGLNVSVLSGDVYRIADAASTGDLNLPASQCRGIRRIEIGKSVMLLLDRRENVVPETYVQCEPPGYTPVILKELPHFPITILRGDQSHIPRRLVVISGKQRREGIASGAGPSSRGVRLNAVDEEIALKQNLERAPIAPEQSRPKANRMTSLDPRERAAILIVRVPVCSGKREGITEIGIPAVLKLKQRQSGCTRGAGIHVGRSPKRGIRVNADIAALRISHVARQLTA